MRRTLIEDHPRVAPSRSDRGGHAYATTPDAAATVEWDRYCPRYHHAVELVGRRWSGAILRAMLGGAVRFNDIAAGIPGLSDRLLAERLKEFVAEGIADRVVIPRTPVRVEYRLTSKGRALAPAIEALAGWAEWWVDGEPVL